MNDSTDNLRWTYDLRRQEPARFSALCVVVALALAMVYFTSPEGTGAGWTLIAVLLLAFWLLPFFIPVTYELTSEGVAIFYGGLRLSFKPWSHYTRCVHDEYGMALKTMVVDSWLDKFRGCFMRFPKGMANRTEIVGFVGGRLKICENTAYAKKRTNGKVRRP